MRQVKGTKEMLHKGPLILVNHHHPMEMGKAPDLVPLDERRPDLLLERLAARLLIACIEDVGGKKDIVPVSGWRSQREQQSIWQETLQKEGEVFTQKYVAYPGCSEHQTGLAIDLGTAADHIDFIRPHFSYEGVCGRFRKMAAKYGFIQRYQEDKQALTGIGAEPWHFRYVGVPHAQWMESQNLCLEEYTDFLRGDSYCCTLNNGQSARVYFVPYEGEDTEIWLPESCYQIAGNNVDGFIITVWGEVG